MREAREPHGVSVAAACAMQSVVCSLSENGVDCHLACFSSQRECGVSEQWECDGVVHMDSEEQQWDRAYCRSTTP